MRSTAAPRERRSGASSVFDWCYELPVSVEEEPGQAPARALPGTRRRARIEPQRGRLPASLCAVAYVAEAARLEGRVSEPGGTAVAGRGLSKEAWPECRRPE